MAALYILIPVAVAIVAVCIWIFFWAVDNGQYDDLDSPAHSILFDDDEKVVSKPQETNTSHNDSQPPSEPPSRG